jgi:hypothetical protein
METLNQVLNRLAHEHLNREIRAYIEKLEKVAQTAKLVVNKNDAEMMAQLKKDLENLDAA